MNLAIPTGNPFYKHINCTLTKGDRIDKPLVIVLHGTGGHRFYCYQRHLAQELSQIGISCLNIDFSGCGEQLVRLDPDKEFPRTIESDTTDIKACVDWGRSNGYRILALVGHSRGAIAAFMYLKQDHEIPFMINCSGRYLVQIYKEKMQEIKKRNPEAVGSWQKYINGQGGQLIDKFVLFEETESLLRSNLIGISDKLNPNIQVLTIFGALDKIIPLSDFGLWVDELGSKGTYQMIANADHNFYGVTSERINYNPQIAKQIRQFLDPKTIQERFYKKTTMVQSKRWIPIDGLENFRDLGGYSPRFPNGLIFRSADLRDLTVLGARQLSKHIAYVFDLRSNPEVHKNGTIGPQKHPIEIPDCERVHVPIFAETDYSPDKIQSRMKMYAQGAQGFLSAYIGVIHNLGPTLAKIFKILAQLILSKEHRGILIHCTAGKDRTGIVCALFLCLGGVAEETICQEYQLTEHGLKDNVDRLLKRIAVDDKEKETKIRNMMGAKAIAMRVTLDHLWKKHGGPIQYIRDRVDPKDFEIVHRTLNGAANL